MSSTREPMSLRFPCAVCCSQAHGIADALERQCSDADVREDVIIAWRCAVCLHNVELRLVGRPEPRDPIVTAAEFMAVIP